MNKVFVEENGVYQIDCTKALWATDAVHEIYRANKVGLKDIDFIIEQEDNILMLEYKNAAIGRASTTDGFASFALRSYVSTMIAQFVDNFVFALIVSHVFFGWSMTQVVVCSLTGCIIELLCEVVFSPIGYKVSKQWEVEHVGKEYLEATK